MDNCYCCRRKHTVANKNLIDTSVYQPKIMKHKDNDLQYRERFSLFASVRPPYSPSRYDPNYKKPQIEGVS